MNIVRVSLLLFFYTLLGFAPKQQTLADEIYVAVASNFSRTIKALAHQYQKKTKHKIIIVPGSTGKHYAQIKNGAPFDIFFAADSRRPKLLEQERLAIPGSRFTYAVGKVALWSLKPNMVDAKGDILRLGTFNHLAIANPKLAPYGQAAKEILKAHNLWEPIQPQLVRGENISQTFQFINSGNAELGFVALSQLNHPDIKKKGSWWIVPESLYKPIHQQAILLKKSNLGRSFLRFVKSHKGGKIIKQQGYGLP